MNWGLKRGLLGARQQTLTPSLASVGHNTYLQQHDFLKMIGFAMLLHAVLIGIASIWPEEKITDIPVRALTFKIGAGQRIAAFGNGVGIGTPVQPQPLTMTPSTPSEWRAARPEKPKPKPVPRPVKQAKVVPLVPPTQRVAPMENPAPLQALPLRAAPAPQPLPDTSILTTQAAIAPTPQRFIRQEPAVLGTLATRGAESPQAVRERYEQEISGWIQRHKLYPANAAGKEGRAIIRVRIDRTGYVRYYALEQSAGSPVLDAAAIDMIRRANPMPAVPATYPAGNLIEFLIPIVFRVPR